jgi:two-component system, OmpR family, sensor histidine kinase VicK
MCNHFYFSSRLYLSLTLSVQAGGSRPTNNGNKIGTEVLYGVESTVGRGIQFMRNVQKKMDISFDSKGPSIVIEVDAYRNGYIDIQKRGARIRALTVVTKENVHYCKKLMKIVDELRHLDGMKGGIAVSESEYMATTVLQEAKPLTQVIYSNVPEAVEQGRYIFEAMWSNAMPAEQRIREIEEGIVRYKTRLVQVPEDILGQTKQMIRNSNEYATCSAPGGLLYGYNHLFDTIRYVLDKIRKSEHRGYRWVTEINSKEIAKVSKIFLDMGLEIRHVNNLPPLSFGISDKEMGTTIDQLEGGRLNQNALFSNEPAYIKHFSSLFEELWKNGIDARIKIKEIEEGVEPEGTEIIFGAENVIKKNLECFSRIRKRIDACYDSTGPSAILSAPPILQAATDFIKRGGKMRMVTEITDRNISYCKELMKYHEIRHLEGTKGNFDVSERDYFGYLNSKENEPMTQAIYSNVRRFVEDQQYVFSTLWEKAIPAEQRIREIERGIKPEIIETLRDPFEIQKRIFKMIKSAKYEIMVIFSTANAFRRQTKVESITLIKEQAERGIKLRIMTPADNYVRKTAEKMKKDFKQVDVRYIEQPMQTTVSVIMVDKLLSMVVELKDDTKENSIEAMGAAIYSNSKATVLSYASIFESLWSQSELYEHIRYLYEQLKAHDKLQKEFINIAAHELRTPIQPILGLAEILRDQSPGESQNKLLDAIIRNARRLLQLQEDILDVTRIESNLLKLDRRRFSLNQMILQIVEDYKNQVDSEKVRLLSRIESDDDIVIEGDRDRLIQVVSNLLGNAIKFTEKGAVSVEAKKRDGYIIVRVHDSGTGIDPDIMPRLFTKFATKSEKGTGLGLFISKSIVEAHGGRMWGENNKDGRGATFTFILPAT